jgi:hypothetical protein
MSLFISFGSLLLTVTGTGVGIFFVCPGDAIDFSFFKLLGIGASECLLPDGLPQDLRFIVCSDAAG